MLSQISCTCLVLFSQIHLTYFDTLLSLFIFSSFLKTTFKSNVAPVSQTWDMHVSHCNCSCIRFIAPEINPLPFFSPLISSPLPDLLLLFVCCCLECHLILFFTSFALLPFDACCAYFFFPPHHGHYDWSPYCRCNFPIFFFFLSGLSCFRSAPLCVLLSFPSWTMFYMFCR